jgi:DNA-binding SARP family transcriptional activator
VTSDSRGVLADLISQHRRLAGLSQRELADAAGISIGVIRDLEQGVTSQPRATSISRLASALQLDPEADLRYSEARLALRDAGQRKPALSPTASLDVRVLGPLAVLKAGVTVSMRPGRPQLVLGLLALSPDETISRADMAEALWGNTAPRNAATMIQSYVVRLRQELDTGRRARGGDGLISSIGSGYRLNSAFCRLDLVEFRQILAEARASRRDGDLASCCRALDRGLSLWRGSPVSNSESLRLRPSAVALCRQRDRAVVSYAEVAAQLGWHDGPLPHLEELVVREPFDERAWADYIVALAGAGRQAAALDAFDQIRRRLRDDLGLSPGPELRDAHARVLRQEVHIAQAAGLRSGTRAFQLPAPVADFTGRGDETSWLLRHLRHARGRPALIYGMPGVGKTTLALQAAQRLREAFPDGQLWAPLYSAGQPRQAFDVLSELLRALGTPAGEIRGSVDELASLFRSHTARRRVLVVADDAKSAEQLGPLLPAGASMLLATSRRESVAPAGAGYLSLSCMGRPAALELLVRLAGSVRIKAEPVSACSVLDACAGLPLALRVAGTKLAARKTWPLSALACQLTGANVIDELTFGETSVAHSFMRSYLELDARTQRLFRQLSSLGTADFSESQAGATPGDNDLGKALASLAERSMVTVIGTDGRGRPRYKMHRLMQRFAASLSAGG